LKQNKCVLREERTNLSTIDVMELARVYEEITPRRTCFTLENTSKYLILIEEENYLLKTDNSEIKKNFQVKETGWCHLPKVSDDTHHRYG
jgi:hypothetical protein